MPTSPAARRATLGLLLTAGGAFLFASKGLFAKALFQEGMDFQTLTLLRSLLALPLFAALAVQRGLRLNRLPPRAIAFAVIAGVVCYGIGALVDFHALELIDVSIERALLFSYPALVVLYTALARRRLPSWSVLAAVVMTYAGILLVVGAFDLAAWQRNWAGSLMVLFCGTTTAAYFLLGERSIPDLGSMGFTIIAMISATVFVTLYYLFSHPLTGFTQVSPRGWLLLSCLAVLCLLLPTLMQAEGIRRIGAVRGALVSTVGPPAALLMGAALLGERPGPWQLLGTALIIVGVLVISRRETSTGR
jgi:drug/metabolite transporter (DMT)-like permease